ncbi:O-antigen ligase family protein [Shewanella sp. S23-S33]|uniref:O-antigen ligase family protein n=1 Tax=Shewanella sp. S23-S33 TaxID=3342769 RepID=UPI00372D3825
MLKKNNWLSHKILLYYTVFIFFFLIANKLKIDVGFSLTPAIALLPITIFILFLKKVRFSFDRLDAALFIFYFFCISSFVYSINLELTFRFALGVFVFFLLLITSRKLLVFNDIFFVLDRVASLFIIFCLFFYLIGITRLPSLVEHQTYYGVFIEKGIPRLTGVTMDPNFAALCLSFFSIYLISRFKYKLAGIAFVLSVLTLSRSGLFSLMCGLIFYFFYSRVSISKKLLYFFSFFTLALVLYYLLNSNYLNLILEKRMAGIENGAGRFDLWSAALNFFYERPFLGSGAFTFRERYERFSGEAKFAHNTLVEIAVEFGLFGFILFVIILFFLFLKIKKSIKLMPEIFFLMPAFILFFIMLNTLSMYINSVFIFFILVFTAKYQRQANCLHLNG